MLESENIFALIQWDSWSQMIALLSFGVSVFLAFLLRLNPQESPPSRLLGEILAIFSLVFLTRYSFLAHSALSIYLPFLTFPFVFWFGPLFYFYARSSLFGEAIKKREWVRGWIAPLIFFLSFTAAFIGFPEFQTDEGIFAQEGMVAVYTNFFLLSVILYTCYFLIISGKLIVEYDMEFEKNYSSDDRSKLIWLKIFLSFNLLMLVAYILIFVLRILKVSKIPITPLEGLINLTFIYLIFYYVVRKPKVFAIGRIPKNETSTDNYDAKTEDKYAKQTLSIEERKEHIRRILDYMEEKKPYLNDRITLPELSYELKIPAHHLSMTINIELGKNFFNFIGFYRVKEAKKLLMDPKTKDENLLHIGFRSGFQSKAAFNKAFKSETGKTPSEFRSGLFKAPSI
ncbi:helix-turn-helix domain-containing protein [Leptospira adleri]|uniref:HTH araC/xylS-type domain-containing protein n=1 Tax=Leptospira adleri TaxID=2023186 RepID=A0A2M9YLC7_9LEPT|nr:AraC family transcriptional regulator [Leptospira adleri]PJZ52358.1 hypothetical protein CH380_15785 [Leptospira adleri]PJZ60009.1 hypothetical protein CH376_20620 [Leptospira adleri]